jgi:nucleoside-diphosphate-sugar epimerase
MTAEWTLVTGGAGYLGSLVVEQLLAEGRRVRVMDALVHGGVPSLLSVWGDERFEFLHADISDPAARRSALEGVREVVHLAAIVGDPACARREELARAVNVEATLGLLGESATTGANRFLFASTCSNYGKMQGNGASLATEEWELHPVSLYAETKVEAELETLRQSRPGFATCCLRFATIYGTSPRMRFDLTVNEFTRDVMLRGELLVYGEQFWRPYVHVRDAARAVALALSAPVEIVAGEVFNIGDTSENYRKLDLVELLQRRVPGAKVEFVHKDEDPRDYKVSFDKAKERLGFEVVRRVDDGIDEVMQLLGSGLLPDPFAEIYRN